MRAGLRPPLRVHIGGVPAGRPGTTGFLSEPDCALADPAGCRRALFYLRYCAFIGVQWFRVVHRVPQCCRSRFFFLTFLLQYLFIKKKKKKKKDRHTEWERITVTPMYGL